MLLYVVCFENFQQKQDDGVSILYDYISMWTVVLF